MSEREFDPTMYEGAGFSAVPDEGTVRTGDEVGVGKGYKRSIMDTPTDLKVTDPTHVTKRKPDPNSSRANGSHTSKYGR